MGLESESIRIRVEERLGLNAISKRLGVPKSTLSGWLRDYPLSSEEITIRCQKAAVTTTNQKRLRGDFDKGGESEIHKGVRANELNNVQIAKVSEAAVMLRMLVQGFNVFGSVFDGDRTDWLVEIPSTGKVCKIQVKTAYRGSAGKPSVSLRRGVGKWSESGRYVKGDFDFMVGYDIFTDTAYVWSWGDALDHQNSVSCQPDRKEKWDLLRV